MLNLITEFIQSTGYYNITLYEGIMVVIAFVLLYLGIVKNMSPC